MDSSVLPCLQYALLTDTAWIIDLKNLQDSRDRPTRGRRGFRTVGRGGWIPNPRGGELSERSVRFGRPIPVELLDGIDIDSLVPFDGDRRVSVVVGSQSYISVFDGFGDSII